jgi:hypothetical protein
LRSQRGAQHARAARDRLRILGLCRHIRPRVRSNRAVAVRSRGRLRKAERERMQQAYRGRSAVACKNREMAGWTMRFSSKPDVQFLLTSRRLVVKVKGNYRQPAKPN